MNRNWNEQVSGAQRALDNACDCCDHGPREAAPVSPTRYADAALEWAGVSERRPFVPSNWQEGDFV